MEEDGCGHDEGGVHEEHSKAYAYECKEYLDRYDVSGTGEMVDILPPAQLPSVSPVCSPHSIRICLRV